MLDAFTFCGERFRLMCRTLAVRFGSEAEEFSSTTPNMNRRDFLVLGALSILAPSAKAGAWESGSFDNDDALDWAHQCVETKGPALISATLNAALVRGYLEAPDCSAAVAAAEVVAAARGKAVKSLPKDLLAWLDRQQKPELAKLAPLAMKAMSRVLNGPDSELRDLWLESKTYFPAWKGHMQDLLARLK